MSELPALDIKPLGPRPRVSFVVAWKGSPAELSRRLRAWCRSIDDSIDVVVACVCETPEQQRIERAHPGVRVIAAPPAADLPTLRQLAVAAAQGDVVVIFDDNVTATSSWRDQLPAALEARAARAQVEWTGYDRPIHANDAPLR